MAHGRDDGGQEHGDAAEGDVGAEQHTCCEVGFGVGEDLEDLGEVEAAGWVVWIMGGGGGGWR